MSEGENGALLRVMAASGSIFVHIPKTGGKSAEQQTRDWETAKARERASGGGTSAEGAGSMATPAGATESAVGKPTASRSSRTP